MHSYILHQKRLMGLVRIYSLCTEYMLYIFHKMFGQQPIEFYEEYIRHQGQK